MSDEGFTSYMRIFRIFSYEKLQEPVGKLITKLKEIPGDHDILIVRPNLTRHLANGTSIESLAGLLQYIGDDPAKPYTTLQDCLLILSPSCGGLSGGMFSAVPTDKVQLDIAETAEVGGVPRTPRKRLVVKADETSPGWPGIEPVFDDELKDKLRQGNWRKALDLVIPMPGSEEGVRFLALNERKNKTKIEIEYLEPHLDAVGKVAHEFAKKCGLPPAMVEVLGFAGKNHDFEKRHPLWQRAAGGSVESPVAKSRPDTRFEVNILNGFRHEFHATTTLTRPEHWSDEQWELALHLIASHHRGARPTYVGQRDNSPAKSYPEETLKVMHRFAALQRRHGAWGLAYLESLLRMADGFVSEDNSA
jgi:CRISPR-associated helicase Cas3